MKLALLYFGLLASCGYVNKGETCVTGGANVALCNTNLVCCAPDPRIADQSGTCVEKTTLAKAGEPCGVSSKQCCELGSACEVDASGNGRCVKLGPS